MVRDCGSQVRPHGCTALLRQKSSDAGKACACRAEQPEGHIGKVRYCSGKIQRTRLESRVGGGNSKGWDGWRDPHPSGLRRSAHAVQRPQVRRQYPSIHLLLQEACGVGRVGRQGRRHDRAQAGTGINHRTSVPNHHRHPQLTRSSAQAKSAKGASSSQGPAAAAERPTAGLTVNRALEARRPSATGAAVLPSRAGARGAIAARREGSAVGAGAGAGAKRLLAAGSWVWDRRGSAAKRSTAGAKRLPSAAGWKARGEVRVAELNRFARGSSGPGGKAVVAAERSAAARSGAEGARASRAKLSVGALRGPAAKRPAARGSGAGGRARGRKRSVGTSARGRAGSAAGSGAGTVARRPAEAGETSGAGAGVSAANAPMACSELAPAVPTGCLRHTHLAAVSAR